MKKCPSCNVECNTSFCPSCGQKQDNKITLRNLAHTILDGITFNKGLFYTYKELCSNPGKMVRSFLSGKTKPYTNPILFLLFTLSLLLTFLTLIENESIGQYDEFKFLIKFSIPSILSFAVCNYLIYLTKKYSFIEQLAGGIYFTSFFLLFLFPYGVLRSIYGQDIVQYIMLIPLLIVFISFQKTLKRALFLKGIGIVLSVTLWVGLQLISVRVLDFILSGIKDIFSI